MSRTRILVLVILWIFASFFSVLKANNILIYKQVPKDGRCIELKKIDFFVEKQNLVLYWTTSTEVNAFQFEVQRKNVDTNRWEPRGHVLASGTSNSTKRYNFLEEEPIVGTSFYRLKVIDIDGSFEYTKQITVDYDEHITNVKNKANYKFNLSQNYPNPFNPSTEILYTVPSQSNVSLSVFNSLGELIKTLSSGIVEAGEHRVKWNASNITSGIYYLQLTAKAVNSDKLFNKTRKMVLIK